MVPSRCLSSNLSGLIPPKDERSTTCTCLSAVPSGSTDALAHLCAGPLGRQLFLPFSTSSTLLPGLALTLSSLRVRTLSSAVGTLIRNLGEYTHSSSPQFAQRINHASHFLIYILCASAKNAMDASNCLGGGQTP